MKGVLTSPYRTPIRGQIVSVFWTNISLEKHIFGSPEYISALSQRVICFEINQSQQRMQI